MTATKFVDAYIWMWGGTKKNAKDVYKSADDNYKRLIVRCYEAQSRLMFWDD